MRVIGRRLQQLRLARGLSLGELAEKMGSMSKQTLSKYESGKAHPTTPVLIRLAQTLGVTTAFLFEEPVVEIIAYRRQARLGVKQCREIEGSASLALEDRVRLQRLSAGGTAPFKVPLGGYAVTSFEDAEKAAGKLRTAWQMGTDPVGNMVDTLENRHVHVLELDADRKFDGLSLRAVEHNKVVGAAVVCRKGVPGDRQRLNLAHELGHLVLEPSEGLDGEKAAMRFAGSFLAPASTLKREVGERRHSIDLEELLLLKQEFGMSMQALLRRMRELDIIGENYYREWFVNFNKTGMRLNEPGPIPHEEGKWLKRTVHNGVNEGWLSKQDGERILNEEIVIAEPAASYERRAFMKLPLEERRRIMAEQAEKIARFVEEDEDQKWRDLQGEDFLDEY